MNRIKNILAFVGVWVTSLVSLLIVAAWISPEIHGYGIAVILFVPIILASLTVYIRKKKEIREAKTFSAPQEPVLPAGQMDKTLELPSFVPPRSVRQQEKLARQLLASINISWGFALEASSMSAFVMYLDRVVSSAEKLKLLDKIPYTCRPEPFILRIQDEYQLHLCNALVRMKDDVVASINNEYRNSREFQEKAFNDFRKDIDSVRNRLSPGTMALADRCIADVDQLLNPVSQTQVARIRSIDFMDGREFEFWCADVLRKNGFCDVEVTKGSGDQGVDVLAEKDGVKYAIQCKCYSSDLGNKPIQEVNAGKTIYHCQIGAVMTNRYFTQGAKDAAAATGILLWNRDTVQQMAKHAGMF